MSVESITNALGDISNKISSNLFEVEVVEEDKNLSCKFKVKILIEFIVLGDFTNKK